MLSLSSLIIFPQVDLLNFSLDGDGVSGDASASSSNNDLLGGFVDFLPTRAPAPTPSNDFFDPFGSDLSSCDNFGGSHLNPMSQFPTATPMSQNGGNRPPGADVFQSQNNTSG